MSSRYFIGIDPGLSGAVAIIRLDSKKFSVVLIADTPVEVVKKGRKLKRQYQVKKMVEVIDNLPLDTVVFLERVASRPAQGIASMFRMGEGLGIWQGIAGALDYELKWATPRVWKATMNIPSGSKKDASVQEAIKLWPMWKDTLLRKKDHGRAEAILICMYGVKTSHVSAVQVKE